MLQREKHVVATSAQIVYCCYEMSNIDNMNIDGHVVSMWDNQKHWWSKGVPVHFTLDELKQAERCFKRGFGNRRTTRNIGVNAFFGEWLSSRPRLTPDSFQGPHHEIREYFRSYFCDQQWAPLEATSVTNSGRPSYK